MVETTSAYTGPQVTCPYPACGQALDTYDFPSHAQNFHSSCNQQLACPICFLETGELFSPNENTNLLSHLNQTHRDAAELRKAIMESERAFLNQQRGFVELPTTIGKGYMAHTLDKDLEQECIICTDEFAKGDTVARLECFCVFHQECIDGWFKKSEKRLCPVHRDEENKAAATT
ncbi:RING-type domain-containing protein, variant 2 [Balamuthia mandrillaris]